MGLLIKCREAHQLVSEGMDRDLSTSERYRLRLHISICDACTRFEKQMQLMRTTLRQLPEHIAQTQDQNDPPAANPP
ncbi:zf-HC2 domain-containing protein [Undibacterium luofuense]|uniref:zf-HC2 domain-containing protein n=1 Tax=Undibacterium luofuense TaxID=2828733 RepID=UPI0030EC5860